MNAMIDIAIATKPKSAGTRRRARITILTSPNERWASLKSTIQMAPLAIACFITTLVWPLALPAIFLASALGRCYSRHRCSASVIKQPYQPGPR